MNQLGTETGQVVGDPADRPGYLCSRCGMGGTAGTPDRGGSGDGSRWPLHKLDENGLGAGATVYNWNNWQGDPFAKLSTCSCPLFLGCLLQFL